MFPFAVACKHQDTEVCAPFRNGIARHTVEEALKRMKPLDSRHSFVAALFTAAFVDPRVDRAGEFSEIVVMQIETPQFYCQLFS